MGCPSCHTQVDGSQRFCPACGVGLTSAGAPAPPARDAILGQTLGGKYKVVRLIGEGGMGAVYEGEQQLGTARRKVAVKTLHPGLSRDATIKARFEREVGTVAELEHPNTIQVFDFGENAEGILYIVMEFLQGKSLAQLLERDGPMAADRVDRILEQICGSLEEAHGRGIVHRDLKPDNVVLVDRAGKKDFVKVLDFGIAKRQAEIDSGEQKLTQQGMVLGTPPYMSPEQFTGRPIDARSDIYSLGVMAYEMLSGRLPFLANTAWEWATQHMTQPPLPLESLAEGARAPERMRSAIRRALAKSPDDRFQTVRQFMDAFSGVGGSGPGVGVAPTAAVTAAAKQRTEMGAPLDVVAAFGGARALPPPGAAGPMQTQTPPANVSFPTPAAIPQPPPRAEGRGAGRATGRPLLLAAAGVIAIVSVGAIVFAMRGGGVPKEVVFDQGAPPPPVTSLAPSAATPSEPTTPAAVGTGADVPPLRGAPPPTGGAVAHSTPHPAASQHMAAPSVQTPPVQAPSQTAPPLPAPAPTPAPTPAPMPIPSFQGP